MTLSRVVGEMTMEVKLPRRSARLRWGDTVRSSWRDDMEVKLLRRSARLRWGDTVKSSWRDDDGGEAP